MKSREIQYFEDDSNLIEAAKNQILKIVKASIKRDGNFTWALSGGNTPKKLYECISKDNGFSSWNKTYLFWSDERLVSLADDLSNYKMAKDLLLDKVNVLEENVFPIYPKSGEDSSLLYESKLKDVFKELKGGSPIPSFDLILLGVGADGHTASLFPGSLALREDKRLVVNVAAPQIDPQVPRVTFTLPLIYRARNVMFLVSGDEKKDVIKAILKNDARYPASLVNTIGNLWWFITK